MIQSFPISILIIKMPISVYHNQSERLNEKNEFILLNSINENKNEKEENIDNDKLIPKPGYNKEEKNNEKVDYNNDLKNNIDKNKKMIEKEVKTYRNDEEKEWNNITNGQILPELININNDEEK